MNNKMDYKNLAFRISKLAEDKKAENIQAFDISSISSFTEVIMIVTARTPVHIKALMRELKKKMKEARPDHVEGDPSGGWVLMDYDGLVLNIFTPGVRDFYSLERLWGDGEKINV